MTGSLPRANLLQMSLDRVDSSICQVCRLNTQNSLSDRKTSAKRLGTMT